MDDAAPIFVGGTGRSGTTQLAAILGQHPRIWALPAESRFLIDPGGLEDVANALTARYTPLRAADALTRLTELLTVRLTGREDSAFAGWNVPALIGVDRYHGWVEDVLADLTWYSYEETVPNAYGDAAHARCRQVARYFPDRDDLLAVLRRRIDGLFAAVAAEQGKDVWCEKTPLNVLSAPFLWELFPTARLVHVTRHPERVVVSHLDQPWAPDDVETVCCWLEPIYRRWLRLRDAGVYDRPEYVQVRLEDLAANWRYQRAQLFTRLRLADAETELTLDPARHTHFWRALTTREATVVAERLGFAYTALGYHPDIHTSSRAG